MANLLDQASIILTPTAYDNGKVLCVKPSAAPYGDFDFSRNSSATRVNAQGLVEDVQILSGNLVQNGDFSEEGSELITNGDFATDSDWTKGTGVTISGGKANFANVASNSNGIYQSSVLQSNKNYRIEFTISNYSTGNITAWSGGSQNIGDNDTFNSNGTKVLYLNSSSTNGILLISTYNQVGNFSIDNVSVKEVGQDWTLETGWSIGNDVANCLNGVGVSIYQTNRVVIGKQYKLTFSVSNYSQGYLGSIANDFGAVVAEADGSYELYGTATSTTFGLTAFGNFIGSITNISLIEVTDDTNLPRINYDNFSYDGSGAIIPNSGCGSWLFEPQSTNLMTRSNELNLWGSKVGVAITPNYSLSPDGSINSNRLLFSSNGYCHNNNLQISGTVYTVSAYAKRNSGTENVGFFTNGSGAVNYAFNLTNEWQRFEYTYTSTNTSTFGFAGISGADISVYGFQAEEQSYATSYIPTEGTTVTRNQDLCTGGGSAALINSTEGVLYAEISALADDLTNRAISLSDGSTNNGVQMFYYNVSNRLRFRVYAGGTLQGTINKSGITITDNHKIALKWKSGFMSVFVDGVIVGTELAISSTPAGLDRLNFNLGQGSSDFFGKTKCLAVWKTALSDTELAELTTI